MAVTLFSDVKNKDVTAPTWTEHPFGPQQLQMKGFIVPVKDLRNLNITFPIPDLHEYYKAGVSLCACLGLLRCWTSSIIWYSEEHNVLETGTVFILI
jgi:secreted Zn-dependent insulinase-like peptidase